MEELYEEEIISVRKKKDRHDATVTFLGRNERDLIKMKASVCKKKKVDASLTDNVIPFCFFANARIDTEVRSR